MTAGARQSPLQAARHTNAVTFSVKGQEASVTSDGNVLIDHRDGTRISLDAARSLRGLHNAQNACAVYVATRRMGLSPAQIEAGFNSFPGLAHRMEEVGHKGRVVFINDSKATNADAAEKALSSFSRIYWIAGGQAKAGGIAPLEPWFGRIARAYLIGQDAGELAATLEGKAVYEICGTMEAAVAAAARDAAHDASEAAEVAVLLSPACASFDQYPNFEVRGEDFRALVQKLDGVRFDKEVA